MRSPKLLTGVASLLLATGAGAALAQPANDLCANAAPLTDGVPRAFNTAGATNTPADVYPTCLVSDATDVDVWFAYTPDVSDTRVVTTQTDNGLNSSLTVYASCGGGAQLACIAESATVSFSATAGQTVYIRYCGTDNSPRTGTIRIGVPVTGDLCTAAVPLSDNTEVPFNTAGTTNTIGDVTPTCLGTMATGNDLWFTYTPTISDTRVVTAVPSVGVAPCISVYTACGGAGTQLACTRTSRAVSFPATAGQTVYIRYGAWNPSTITPYNLAHTGTIKVHLPVTGDLCTAAVPLSDNVEVPFDTAGTTNTMGDVNPTCLESIAEGNDLWFVYTPSVTDTRVVTAVPSSGGVTPCISVYTACGGLGTQLACTRISRDVSFPATAGQTVYIRYGAWNPAINTINNIAHTGTIKVHVPVAADLCSAAVPLTDNVAAPFDTAGTTNTIDDVNPTCLGTFAENNDLWFTYTPSVTDTRVVTVAPSGGSVTPCISVYSACGGAGTQLACASGSRAVSFSATAGQAVYIRYSGLNNTAHVGTIKIQSPVVFNDLCDNATLIADGLHSCADLVSASLDGSSEICPALTLGRDIWFRYTKTTDGLMKFSGIRNGEPTNFFITVLDNCNGAELACDSSAVGLYLNMLAGQSVLVRVSAHEESLQYQSENQLAVMPVMSNVNDECAGAQNVARGSVTLFDTTTASDSQSTPHPSCATGSNPYPRMGKDLWFKHTAVSSGLVNFAVVSSKSLAMAIYDGSCAGEEIICTVETRSGEVRPVTLSVALAAGQTVYVQVGDLQRQNGPASGAGLFVVGPPPNDQCANAMPVTSAVSVPLLSQWSTTDDPIAGYCVPEQPDVWYEYVANSNGKVVVALQSMLYGNMVDDAPAVISAVSACGGTVLGCGHPLALSMTSGERALIRVMGQSPGNDHEENGRVLWVFDSATAAADECANAQVVTSGTSITYSDVIAENSIGIGEPTCAPISTGHDVWFQYTAPASGTTTFDVRLGEGGIPPVLTAYSVCGGTELGCAWGDSLTSLTLSLSAGQHIVIRSSALVVDTNSLVGIHAMTIQGPATSNCCRGTTCLSVTAGSCVGQVAGSNSVTVSACTGNTIAGCCFGDYDHNGVKDITDIFTFLNAWFGASTYADITGNGAGTPDITDIFTFLNAWFGDCS